MSLAVVKEQLGLLLAAAVAGAASTGRELRQLRGIALYDSRKDSFVASLEPFAAVEAGTRARAVTIGMHSIRMLALEDILEHKLQTISKASRADPVDPKHARHAVVLGTLFGRTIPEVAEGSSIEDVYGTDVHASCRPCELSSNPDFPLAPKNQILNLLGWMRLPN